MVLMSKYWECGPNRSSKTNGGCLRFGFYHYVTLSQMICNSLHLCKFGSRSTILAYGSEKGPINKAYTIIIIMTHIDTVPCNSG